MDIPDKIEIYSAMPYEGNKEEDETIDDWFHVSYNDTREHIEAVWDIETMFRPDVDSDIPLGGIEEHFEKIRLHYALNRVSHKYHENLMLWVIKALKPGGKLQIISPDLDYILMRWLGNSLVPIEDSTVINNDSDKWFAKITRVFRGSNVEIISETKSEIEDTLKASDIPLDSIPQEETDDFDLWLLDKLYSSGSGEPQDCFKATFNKRYLSQLLNKTLLIVDSIDSNADNPSQMIAFARKHESRLFL